MPTPDSTGNTADWRQLSKLPIWRRAAEEWTLLTGGLPALHRPDGKGWYVATTAAGLPSTWEQIGELLGESRHDIIDRVQAWVLVIRAEKARKEGRGKPSPAVDDERKMRSQDRAAPTIRDKALEARDRWIYSECCKGTQYDRIAILLNKKPASWQRIESPQGIRSAAMRYAARHGLSPIPRRQDL